MEHSFIEEHDLVSRYVAGHLPEEEARAFESHFVSCPTCLDGLEIEQALRGGLMNAGGDWRAASAGPRAPGRGRLISLRTIAAAAAVLVAVGTSVGYLQIRSQLGAAQTRLAAAERESAQARARADQLARTAGTSTNPATLIPPPPARITVVELDTTRSADASRTEVTVPPATSMVVFSLPVGNATDYARFDASLQTASGATIVRQDDLRAASSTTVAVALDAPTLLAGDYTIVLEGAIRNRQPVTIARFPIRVSRR